MDHTVPWHTPDKVENKIKNRRYPTLPLSKKLASTHSFRVKLDFISTLNVHSLKVQLPIKSPSGHHHLSPFASLLPVGVKVESRQRRKERTLTFVEPQIKQSLPSSATSIDLERKTSNSLAQLLGSHLIFPSQRTRRHSAKTQGIIGTITRQELIVIQHTTTLHSFAEPFMTMFSNMLARAGLLAGIINAAVAATSSSSSVPTISAVGSKFFFSNGTQYFVKGTPILCLSFEECG